MLFLSNACYRIRLISDLRIDVSYIFSLKMCENYREEIGKYRVRF